MLGVGYPLKETRHAPSRSVEPAPSFGVMTFPKCNHLGIVNHQFPTAK